MTNRLCLSLTLAALSASASVAAPARSSVFTKVADKSCRLIEENKETGDWTRRCPGAGPYRLEWSSGDLRDDLTIIHGRQRTELRIPELVAKGPFDSIGETVEWRGPAGGAPDVLVVRVHVARPDGTDDSGRLAVARLGKKPCVVAVISPSKDQSALARRAADGRSGNCLTP